MNQLLRMFAIASAVLSVGCDDCFYETRFVGTSGKTSSSAGTVTATDVNMREYRDGPVPNYLTWNVTGEGLSSAPKTLTLRDGQGAVVQALTFSSSSSVSFTANGSVDVAAGDSRFSVLQAGTARLVLELQDGTTIEVALAVTDQEGWHHPSCG